MPRVGKVLVPLSTLREAYARRVETAKKAVEDRRQAQLNEPVYYLVDSESRDLVRVLTRCEQALANVPERGRGQYLTLWEMTQLGISWNPDDVEWHNEK